MSPELRRPLSPVERWYWIADQVSPLNVVARVHLHGHMAAGLLERAAIALVAEHPSLRVAITSDANGTNPTFMPSAGISPIRRVRGDVFEWERQVDQYELGTSLDWHSGPLVRIVDVALDSPEEEHDLVLTVSHIIADATTALSVLHRLIEHADRLAAAAPVDDLVASRLVLGAPEELLPARYVATSNAAPGWQVSVGGVAAVIFAATQYISHATPIVIATMLAVIYLLLALTFRSLLLPCKAIALNLLSVGAAMGAVVLIFQHGFLADALRIASVGPIQTFVPILLVVMLFSLSTDYEVFLLSRVRERYQQTGDNTGSVVYGLVETAPLISGAALLMATIFAAFVVVQLVSVQQVGLAMAIAIAIDATIVRLVMVPAAMRLMGRWNWWLPRRISTYRGSIHLRRDDRAPSQTSEEGVQWVP